MINFTIAQALREKMDPPNKILTGIGAGAVILTYGMYVGMFTSEAYPKNHTLDQEALKDATIVSGTRAMRGALSDAVQRAAHPQGDTLKEGECFYIAETKPIQYDTIPDAAPDEGRRAWLYGLSLTFYNTLAPHEMRTLGHFHVFKKAACDALISPQTDEQAAAITANDLTAMENAAQGQPYEFIYIPE